MAKCFGVAIDSLAIRMPRFAACTLPGSGAILNEVVKARQLLAPKV